MRFARHGVAEGIVKLKPLEEATRWEARKMLWVLRHTHADDELRERLRSRARLWRRSGRT